MVNIATWQLFAMVFAFFDSFATWMNLRLGNIAEGNAILAAAMADFGVEPVLMYRTVIVFALLFALGLMATRSRRAMTGLRFVTLALAMVAVYHVVGPSLLGAAA